LCRTFRRRAHGYLAVHPGKVSRMYIGGGILVLILIILVVVLLMRR
jgi:hypothetical protein